MRQLPSTVRITRHLGPVAPRRDRAARPRFEVHQDRRPGTPLRSREGKKERVPRPQHQCLRRAVRAVDPAGVLGSVRGIWGEITCAASIFPPGSGNCYFRIKNTASIPLSHDTHLIRPLPLHLLQATSTRTFFVNCPPSSRGTDSFRKPSTFPRLHSRTVQSHSPLPWQAIHHGSSKLFHLPFRRRASANWSARSRLAESCRFITYTVEAPTRAITCSQLSSLVSSLCHFTRTPFRFSDRNGITRLEPMPAA